MASIKLNANKSYHVNFRLLEATQPSTVRIGIGEKPGVSEPPTPPGADTPTCTDQSVAQFKDFTPQTIFRGDFYNLKNGEIGSVKVKPRLPRPDGGFQESMSFIVANPAPGGETPNWTEAVISECRGSFQVPPGNQGRENRCRVSGATPELLIDTHSGTTPNQFQCILNPNKDYYINFRYKNPDNNQDTCQVATGCSSIVSIGYSP